MQGYYELQKVKPSAVRTRSSDSATAGLIHQQRKPDSVKKQNLKVRFNMQDKVIEVESYKKYNKDMSEEAGGCCSSCQMI